LTTTDMKDYFRPNFFVNTPDILPEILQKGGRPAFCFRGVLAATLSPLYGIYSGYELCENTPVPGREEYLDSEKYQFKGRNWNPAINIKPLITSLNAIRRANPALRELANLRFLNAENDNILFYEKRTGDNAVFVAVTLDPYNKQSAFVHIPITDFGIAWNQPYVVEDLLTGEKFTWVGEKSYVEFEPSQRIAHMLRVVG